jgi:HEAT repeat protein
MAPVVALEPLRNIVLAVSGAVLLLFAFLLLVRLITKVSTGRVQRREGAVTRVVYRCLGLVSGSPPDLRTLSSFDRRLIRRILLHLALDLRGETSEKIVELYRQLGFLHRDLGRLRSWRAITRANAAADLGVVRAAEAVPALLTMLDDPDMRVRQSAVWALGQAGEPDTLAALIRLLGDPSRPVARRAHEVLAERGGEIKNAIVAYAATTASRPGRLASIELIGWLRITEGADLLLTFATDLDAEVRVKSVKAAAAIGDPRFLDVFHQSLEDGRWEVRCQAAKGLSVFGSPESIPPLRNALRDRQWWVRFYAATALAEIGSLGEAALHEALRDPEASVREMARYLLERGDAVPSLP